MNRTLSGTAPVSDAELDAILARNNLSQTGALSREDVRAAFASLTLPPDYADRVFAKMDADSDGRVTREELKQFVSFKMQRLRAAFGTVDRDSDGFITAHEVQAVLEAAHLKATVEDTETLLRVMQAGAQDSKVSFPQFLATFALLEPLDLLAMFDKDAHLFELGSAGDLAGVLKGRQLTRRQTQALEKKAATNDNLALRLFAAGIAATLAQTACQPIETVKVRLHSPLHAHTHTHTHTLTHTHHICMIYDIVYIYV